MTPCLPERRDVPITRRDFEVDGEPVEVVELALTLDDGGQLAMGDLKPQEFFRTRDGRIVKRTR